MSSPPDLSPYLLSEFRKLVPRLRAVERESFRPVFQIETIIGRLDVTPIDDFIACRFDDVEKAKKHFGITTIQQGRLNPFSGKWNWHWFEGVTYQSRPTKENVTKGIDKILADLVKEIEALLPVAV